MISISIKYIQNNVLCVLSNYEIIKTQKMNLNCSSEVAFFYEFLYNSSKEPSELLLVVSFVKYLATRKCLTIHRFIRKTKTNKRLVTATEASYYQPSCQNKMLAQTTDILNLYISYSRLFWLNLGKTKPCGQF